MLSSMSFISFLLYDIINIKAFVWEKIALIVLYLLTYFLINFLYFNERQILTHISEVNSHKIAY